MKRTNTKPPVEIFDVLHEAEKRGVDLPVSIKVWWFEETATNEEKKAVKKLIIDMYADGK